MRSLDTPSTYSHLPASVLILLLSPFPICICLVSPCLPSPYLHIFADPLFLPFLPTLSLPLFAFTPSPPVTSSPTGICFPAFYLFLSSYLHKSPICSSLPPICIRSLILSLRTVICPTLFTTFSPIWICFPLLYRLPLFLYIFLFAPSSPMNVFLYLSPALPIYISLLVPSHSPSSPLSSVPLFAYFQFFFYVRYFFHEHLQMIGLLGKGQGISVTPCYHVHSHYRH